MHPDISAHRDGVAYMVPTGESSAYYSGTWAF
jgi:hypothetical protein